MGVGWPLGKNENLRFRGQNEMGERRKGENCLKNELKGLKIASFWAINYKHWGGEVCRARVRSDILSVISKNILAVALYKNNFTTS